MSQVLTQHPGPSEGGKAAALGRPVKERSQPIPHTAMAAGRTNSPVCVGEALCPSATTFPPCRADSRAAKGRVAADRGGMQGCGLPEEQHPQSTETSAGPSKDASLFLCDQHRKQVVGLENPHDGGISVFVDSARVQPDDKGSQRVCLRATLSMWCLSSSSC